MLNPLTILTNARVRYALACVLATGLVTSSGCTNLFGIKQTVGVPPLLTPRAEANATQLMAEVNRLAAIRSIRGKLDIQFQDTSFAESGIAEKYRSADATVILQRPGNISLAIQVPFISTDIAQMTSDGDHFRVAVLQGDEKYRRFVRGTNNAIYSTLSKEEVKTGRLKDGKKRAMNEQHAVNVLSNLRPQHFTDALLIRPITPRAESGLVYAQSEHYEEEADKRPQAKKGARVVRGYYLLDELMLGGASGARLVRRFWFDRVGGIRLARLQTFNDGGTLVTDVQYGGVKGFGEGGRLKMPSHIELTRPQDGYKLSLDYQAPEEVVLDHEYPPDVFVLQNKWQLPEVDLDARDGRRAEGRQ